MSSTVTSLHATRDWSAALAYYEQALRLAPDDPRTHFELGRAASELGDAERSRRHLVRVLELQPGHAQARLLLDRLRE